MSNQFCAFCSLILQSTAVEFAKGGFYRGDRQIYLFIIQRGPKK